MAEILLSFVILLAIVAAMSIGVMRGRKPISGSCGGLNNLGVGGACEICGGDTNKCDEINKGPDSSINSQTNTFYDAS